MLEMDRLKFVWPSMELRPQALEYREEFLRSGETELHGAALFDQMDFEPWLELTVRNRRAETARSDWVQSSTFFVVRERDGRIIGMVDVRHRLNGFLAAFGGHIGYGVRPSERRKGYATQILRMALEYAGQEIGLKRVMIACYRDNEGSWRTILANGGRLEREFAHTDGRTVQVYWVEL